jgi:hypothetical protein
MSVATILILAVIVLVSSGALFVILRWLGVIGTEVAAEIEGEDGADRPR